MVIYMKIHGIIAASTIPNNTRTAANWLKFLTNAVPIVSAPQPTTDAVSRYFGVRIFSRIVPISPIYHQHEALDSR